MGTFLCLCSSLPQSIIFAPQGLAFCILLFHFTAYMKINPHKRIYAIKATSISQDKFTIQAIGFRLQDPLVFFQGLDFIMFWSYFRSYFDRLNFSAPLTVTKYKDNRGKKRKQLLYSKYVSVVGLWFHAYTV